MGQRTYTKNMGYSHVEFFRLLPVALGTTEYEIDGLEISYSPGTGKQLKIILGPQASRNIALLAIPITPVNIYLSGYSDLEALSFMKLFEQTYQRGGG